MFFSVEFKMLGLEGSPFAWVETVAKRSFWANFLPENV